MRVTPSSRTTFAELDDRSAQMAARLVKAEVVKGGNAGYCAYGLGYFRIGGVDEGAHLAATPAVLRLHSGNCFTTSFASSAHTIPTLWKPGWNSPSAGTIR
jgi:predicted methyltransferase